MFSHFSEENTLIVLGLTAAANTSLTSPYVNSSQCKMTNLIGFLQVGAAATAANAVTFEVLAASDDSGTGAEAVPFQYAYVTKGAVLMKDGTGVAEKVEFKDANGAGVDADEYVTPTADGLKEMLVVIPIRERQVPSGKKWLALKATTGGTSRNVQFAVIRHAEQYGTEGRPVLL